MSLFIDETPERKIERLSREIDFIETELRKSIVERQELVAYRTNINEFSEGELALELTLRKKITELEDKRQNKKSELEELLRSKKH